MKKILKYIIPFVSLLFICTIAGAQLKLTLESEKTSYNLGEPVLVYITVTNTGNDEVEIYEEFIPEMTEYFYYITGPDSKEQVFSPVMAMEPDKKVSLKRGASVSGSVELFFGAGKYYFSKPGSYKITAKHKEFTSNALSVKIAEPASDEAKEAAQLVLNSPEMGLYYVLGGNDELEEANQIINRMSSEFSKAPITNYFLLVKAQSLTIPSRNYVTQKHRGPKYDDALKLLNQVKEVQMPIYYKSKNAALTAKVYQKTDRKEEAVKELESFKTTLNSNQAYKKYFIKDVDAKIMMIEK